MVAILRYYLLACNPRRLTHEGIKLFEWWEVLQQLVCRIINEALEPLFPLECILCIHRHKMIEMTLPHAAGSTNSLTRNEKMLNSPAKHTRHKVQWIKFRIFTANSGDRFERRLFKTKNKCNHFFTAASSYFLRQVAVVAWMSHTRGKCRLLSQFSDKKC